MKVSMEIMDAFDKNNIYSWYGGGGGCRSVARWKTKKVKID